MKFILRSLLKVPHQRQQGRSIFESATSIKWVRDRALDHAVEKERNLKPMLNLKNLIKLEPSKSLPLSLIVQNKHSLDIPIRPIDFIRKYPPVFDEFLPGGIGINPHVKLTPEVLDLDAEEQLIYQTENHKQDVAGRLLKLLMIGRINKIPLHIIDKLTWDLGLPQDYAQSIVPEFPDYFQVSKFNDSVFLELVCWNDELAVSVMEKKAMSGEMGYRKGMPIAFPIQYSRGFDIDKKFKKWVEDWQKLPYISPYDNALHFLPKSDESDKWAVAVLHEVLSLFVPKKTGKDNILTLGEYFGVRSRFKKALLQHPGIFYISSKLRTHTVVLREGYRRDLLTGKHHPLMGMRSKYIHLMNMVKEEPKSKSAQSSRSPKGKTSHDSKEWDQAELEDDDSEGEQDHMTDSEFDDESDDDEEEEDGEDESSMSRGRTARKTSFEEKNHFRKESKFSGRRNPNIIMDKHSPTFSRRKEMPGRQNVHESSQERLDVPRARGKTNPNRFEEKNHFRNEPIFSGRRNPNRTMDKHPPTFSRRKEMPGRQNVLERSQERLDVPRTRGKNNPNRTLT